MPTFFHAPIPLTPGSGIEPGNWGRVLATYEMANKVLYRETIFEQVRREFFPEKPSRLQAIFLFETLNDAIAHHRRDGTRPLVYKVIAQTPPNVTHYGDDFYLDISEGPGFVNRISDAARSYWTWDRTHTPARGLVEVVTMSTATITERIST